VKLDPELLKILNFLGSRPDVRRRLPAEAGKTVVYSGGIQRGDDVYPAWKMLEQAKKQDPLRFDYVTLEERLRQFHIVQFGETLYEHANRVATNLKQKGLDDQALVLWRTLSGVYIQGAKGIVRALILPNERTARSVFSLTEVNVLLKPDVLNQIQVNPELLRNFKMEVNAGFQPTPIVVF
jgi:hypothetical protein